MIDPKKITSAIISVAIMFQSAVFLPASAVTNDKYTVTHTSADSYGEIISGAFYKISPCNSEKYITASDNNTVCQWEALSDSSQRWQIVSVENGYCKILSASSPNLSLTVENADSTNGNKMILAEYENKSSQHFRLNRTGNCYYITAQCSKNAALDVYGQSSENGAVIDQWDYWGGQNQKFYIIPDGSEGIVSFGDLNSDGKTDIVDRILLESGCENGFDDISASIADLNKDGINNYKDITAMNEYFFGLTGSVKSTFETQKDQTAYLFAYFLGNDPSQEQLSYAVSTDGYNFKALNNGNAVWKSDVGTGCIRDPYIFKGEDGIYYLLATDMKSSLGWSSNRNIISARSTDLINWTDITLIEIAGKYPATMDADRAWAPQAIYDSKKNSYMIYWANHSSETGNRTIMYYAYSSDMKTFDTQPALLFAPANGDSAIDSDIIFQNGKYYMYYKNETNKRIYLGISENANGPYTEVKQISEGSLGVEGPNIYNISGTDSWLLMSDAYGDGYYVMQQTNDLENFTTVSRNDYSFDFTPRHGYVIPITDKQYTALVNAFPSSSATPHSTQAETVKISADKGEKINVWAIRPYVLRCDGDPYTGNWTECGQMQASYDDTESFTNFSLDMTYFEHNGKHYVIWAEIKGDSSLFMAQINPDEPWKLTSKPILLTKPEYNWEKVNNKVNEGAAVLKTNSKIYVFFSASGTGSEYCVGRLEANIDSDLMNISSWRKITSPVLQTSDLNGPTGPGHNSFVTDENGDLLLVYHARPASHDSKECGTYCSEPLYDPCRHTRIKRVFFDKNNVPVINMNSQKELASAHRTVTAVINID